MILLERKFLFGLVTLALVICVQCQEEEEAPPAEEAAPPDAPAEEEAAPAATDGEPGSGDGGESPAEGSAAGDGAAAPSNGDDTCEEGSDDGSGSGDSIEGILALGGGKKCKSKEKADEGADGLAAALAAEQCDTSGMDDKLSGCLDGLSKRVQTLEQAVLSGEGGGLEGEITNVLVKKGVIDCENDTQCADDRACLSSLIQKGRKLCELPCDRTRCNVPYSECKTTNHIPECVCKEGFNGNGTVSCIPDGFTEEANGKHYRMFDEEYVEFVDGQKKCNDMGARLPVLDSAETIEIIKKYLENGVFAVFEQWDRSSRRIWIGLTYERRSGLLWADGRSVASYPASASLFVWEARRVLSAESSRADGNRNYGFYIDGDIAKLPGGGRKGAAVLCELLPEQLGGGTSGRGADAYRPPPTQRQRGGN